MKEVNMESEKDFFKNKIIKLIEKKTKLEKSCAFEVVDFKKGLNIEFKELSSEDIKRQNEIDLQIKEIDEEIKRIAIKMNSIE